jgi:hypothetical protein
MQKFAFARGLQVIPSCATNSCNEQKSEEDMTRVSLSRRPRQTDIARFAGVSVSTVSRVLANEPGISTNVRDEVIRIASELGYNIRPVPSVQPQDQRPVALIPVDQATGGLGVFYEGILSGLRAERFCRAWFDPPP